MDAIISGSAAFFAPEIGITPLSAAPPRIFMRSIPLSLCPHRIGRLNAATRAFSTSAPRIAERPRLRPFGRPRLGRSRAALRLAPLQILPQRHGETGPPEVLTLFSALIRAHAGPCQLKKAAIKRSHGLDRANEGGGASPIRRRNHEFPVVIRPFRSGSRPRRGPRA